MPKTILLADDSVTIRKVVELTFSDTDIRVESVGSGREALDRMVVVRPDLVLADVAMPEPSGYEVCRQVKESERPVPVLLLAGTFEPFDPERARACGADGHVVKPFESSYLQEKVESLLSGSTEAEIGEPAATEPSPDEELEEVFQDLAAAAEPSPEVEAPFEAEIREVKARLEAQVSEVEARPGPDLPEVETPEATVAWEHEAEEAMTGVPEYDATAETEPVIEEASPAEPAWLPEAAQESDAPVGLRLTAEDIDAVARAVTERLATDVLREIAWDVVPQLAEVIIRERIRQLEKEVED